MPYIPVSVALSLILAHAVLVDGLVISGLANSRSDNHEARNLTVNSTHANDSQSLHAYKDASYLDSYYSCTGSNCTVNTTKMSLDFQSGVILFLGCSLDILAIKSFCKAAHSQLYGFEDNFAYLSHCVVGAFTLVYVYHPGATAPPYFHGYVGTITTQEIIDRSSKDVAAKFGQGPTAIIVDSSLWDVSNWWAKTGFPPEPYPVPSQFMAHWCYYDLPNLLQYTAAAFPGIHIAYRTPPPVFTGNEYGQSPEIIDALNACIKEHAVDFMDKKTVYGKYGLIDFYGIVKNAFLHVQGNPISIYDDVLHPGTDLSMSYINHVLQWVRGFSA